MVCGRPVSHHPGKRRPTTVVRGWHALEPSGPMVHSTIGQRVGDRPLYAGQLVLARGFGRSSLSTGRLGRGGPVARVRPVETVAHDSCYRFHSYSGNIYLGHSPICTEKDALKLWKHAPDAIAVPLVFTLDPAFLAALDQCLEAIPPAAHAGKLSSSHGHTIT